MMVATASGDSGESISAPGNNYDKEKNNILLAYRFMSPNGLMNVSKLRATSVSSLVDWRRGDGTALIGRALGELLERERWAFEKIAMDSKPVWVPPVSTFSK